MMDLYKTVHELILNVGNTGWVKVERNSNTYHLLAGRSNDWKVAYSANMLGVTYIVAMTQKNQAVLYITIPFGVDTFCITHTKLVDSLFKVVNEYYYEHTYTMPKEHFDVLPLIKAVVNTPSKNIHITHTRLSNYIPESYQYAIMDLNNELTLIACYDESGIIRCAYVVNATKKWHMRIQDNAAFSCLSNYLNMMINTELSDDERTLEIVYNFLSAYAPKALFELGILHAKNPDLSLYQLSKLAKNMGGTK